MHMANDGYIIRIFPLFYNLYITTVINDKVRYVYMHRFTYTKLLIFNETNIINFLMD